MTETNGSPSPGRLRARCMDLDTRERPIAIVRKDSPLGRSEAENLAARLASTAAWQKFKAICEAQGGLRSPPVAACCQVVSARGAGRVAHFDNRRLSRVAKLAGAPAAPAAGIELHVHLGDRVEKGHPLYNIHAETRGELEYANECAGNNGEIIGLERNGEGCT